MIPYFSFEKIQIGFVSVYILGLFMALGFLAVFLLIFRRAKKGQIEAKILVNSFSWLLIGAIIGARLGYVFQHFNYYSLRPSDVLKIWEGGMAFHGGLTGVLLAGLLYCLVNKINFPIFLQAADLVGLFAPLGVAIGRIGCFLINDHQGAETALPWGIIWPDGTIRHPVALYLIIANLLIFLILTLIKNSVETKPGLVLLWFLGLYSVFRLVLDFTRSSGMLLSDPKYLGFFTAQWLSMIIILGIIIIITFRKSKFSIFG